MKVCVFFLLLLASISSAAFAKKAPREDAYTQKLHGQICDLIKKSKPNVDLDACKSTGEILLGGYDSEEIVYQVHRVEFTNRSDAIEYYCVVSGPTLLLESCQDWREVSRRR